MYGLVRDTDLNIPARTILGGFGGGELVPATSNAAAIKWSMPKGDKTWFIMLNKDGEDEEEGPNRKDGRVTTLFSALKTATKKAPGKDIKITSFGHMSLGMDPGRQSFEPEFKETDAQFTPMEYQSLESPKKKKDPGATAGGFFKEFCHKTALEGGLVPVFRGNFERAQGAIDVRKPFLCTGQVIRFHKNKPRKLAWLSAV